MAEKTKLYIAKAVLIHDGERIDPEGEVTLTETQAKRLVELDVVEEAEVQPTTPKKPAPTKPDANETK